jgi:signal peptidase II
MAWGTEIPGAYGIFNAFRLVAVGGIGYWLWIQSKEKTVQII